MTASPSSSKPPAPEIRQRVDFLKDYLRSTPAKGYVLGISGPRAAR
jgi:NAD+ synthase